MSDDLTIAGGGQVAVASDELFARAQALERVHDEISACAAALATIDGRVSTGRLWALDAPISAARAEQALDDAAVALHDATMRAALLARALRGAADAYGFGERALDRLGRSVAAEIGIGFGSFATTIGVLLAPGFALAGLASAGAYLAWSTADPRGAERARTGVAGWLTERRGILSDPRFVELVRLSVMSADDLVGGAFRVPAPVVRSLGDDGFGVVGLDTTVAGLVGIGAVAGALRESPIDVSATRSTTTGAPSGIAGRAARVPEGSAQVRVDRYSATGSSDRFEVYIGGTNDFSPIATDEPWDLTSNLQGLAGADSGSYRATLAALEAAGVRPGDEIVVTGYSQGGLVGAMIAASGDFEVKGLVTLGAPAGQVEVPASVPWVAIEHSDDLVPALGGSFESDAAVVVSRRALDEAPTGDVVFPAHQLDGYRHTAELADAAADERLVRAARLVDTFSEGAGRVESTWYEARRMQPP